MGSIKAAHTLTLAPFKTESLFIFWILKEGVLVYGLQPEEVDVSLCGQHKHVFITDLSHSSLRCTNLTINPSRIHICLKDITLQGNISLNTDGLISYQKSTIKLASSVFAAQTHLVEVCLDLDDALIQAYFSVKISS